MITIMFCLQLSVTERVVVFGTFNGIQLSQVVRLNNEQFFPGMTTFRHLEVLETLEVHLYRKLEFPRVINDIFFFFFSTDGSKCNNFRAST